MPHPHTLFLVTDRCIQERFLLRPSKRLKALILGIIGRAQHLFPEIRIYAFKFVSNHYHIMLSAPDVKTMSAFMEHIKGNIAREVGRVHDWGSKFWGGRFKAVPILDDESSIRDLRYVFSHGCKEGLVEQPMQWPGASCERALLYGEKLVGIWIDRTAYGQADRRSKSPANIWRYTANYEVQLSRLPCLADRSEDQAREFYREMVADIEQETRQRNQANGIQPVGIMSVLSVDPHSRPQAPKKSPAPKCHARTRKIKEAYLAGYRAFVSMYREATDRFRRGECDVRFPENCFLPTFAVKEALLFSTAPG